MGLFLETAIIPGRTEAEVRAALSALEGKVSHVDLKPSECQVREQNGGVSVLFNEYCAGYGAFAQALSAQVGGLVLHLYIYDDDFWGYFCCENGKLLDEFNPMPDYFGEASEKERQRVAGNRALIAEKFHVPEAEIERYLISWTEEFLEADVPRKAYESDRASIGDCWQMTWLMEKLGYSYDWE